jgi:acylphosphatase
MNRKILVACVLVHKKGCIAEGELVMYKSLRITLSASNIPTQFLKKFIQKKALELELEGTAQMVKPDAIIRIFVNGLKDQVDLFIDFLHKSPGNIEVASIEVEPFFKEKDYRGVFRIVE